ncbi:hypothetical protein GCM10007862_17110 [Dyella lipolytica]|uniref:Uncharacterized protein n=1 Tax=Dyella lipolytica TaxID=1867835 RepID=A0ABW8IT02_9GAMM|nr:hypothetical protein [Dyella lipolytica]GLQ46660.1 hypothetical protein GCM10007862_17110 [Dyella lipolytica]
MLSVVDFLERMGSDAQWRNASQDEVEIALAEAEVEAPLRDAILARDASKLEALLQQGPLIAMFVPPDEEEEGEEDDEDDSGEKPHPQGARDSQFRPSLRQP